MAFPLSPANNQTALVNGIVYQWNSALGVWKRNGSINSASIGQLLLTSAQQSTTNGSGTLIVAGGAGITGNVYTGGIYITGSANGITFADGSSQTTAVSSATGAAAYGQANAAFAQANAAFDQANAAFTQANAANQYANSAYAKANTVASDLANFSSLFAGIEATQNTRITNAETRTQAAFDAANSKFSSSGGTITGDTVVTGNLTITGATVYANTENLTVKDNIITLNSNVTGAPSLSAGIEVNRGSSTNTKLLWSEANTAWEFTNNGTTNYRIADTERVNAAFTAANSATTLAQNAYNTANTALNSSAVLTSTVDTFSGDGSNTAFTLSVTPATINYTTAVVGGVTQPKSAYSVVGTTLTFTSAPANGQIVEITTIGTSNTTLYTVNNIISPFLLMGA